MAKISIDFGTSFSTAAYLDPNSGKPQAIIFNENGDVKMPTVVYIYRPTDKLKSDRPPLILHPMRKQ